MCFYTFAIYIFYSLFFLSIIFGIFFYQDTGIINYSCGGISNFIIDKVDLLDLKNLDQNLIDNFKKFQNSPDPETNMTMLQYQMEQELFL